DKVTQINTASAEESAATSEELSAQAQQLQQLLTQFTLKNAVGLVDSPQSSDELIRWEDSYATGIDTVDAQHRRLIELINALFSCMKQGGDNQTVAEAVTALVDYTRVHFTDEERLMRRHGYPELEAHQGIHETFVNAVEDYQRRLAEGQRLRPAELFNFLKGWLIHHIKEQDIKGYAPFILEKLAH
ncbi:MAG: bacteriohemerythrin, partial [Gammaproteobacteria bacterium]